MGLRFSDESVAAAYDRLFTANLFVPWARLLVELVAVRPGDVVLDVATGPGLSRVWPLGIAEHRVKLSESARVPQCWMWLEASHRSRAGPEARLTRWHRRAELAKRSGSYMYATERGA